MSDDDLERLYILATSLAKVRAAADVAGSAMPFVPEAAEATRLLVAAGERLEKEWERLEKSLRKQKRGQ